LSRTQGSTDAPEGWHDTCTPYHCPTSTERDWAISATSEAIEAGLLAAAAIDDKKGLDITLLDISELLVVTDVFAIASGTSNRHVRTLCDEVEGKLKDETGRQPLRREGREYSRWVLLDYGDLVVHVFDQETRDYYQLERLWADAPRIAYEPASAEA
jgi:ribosome-associated protein